MTGSKFTCENIPDLSGKKIFITGGTSGLGAASALELAKHNAEHIYISGRNAKSAGSIIQQVRDTGSTTKVSFVECDLSSLSSVKTIGERFAAQTHRLDILMCNAGIMARPLGLTLDGYEIQFGTNHLGHALLIRKLLPLLKRTASQGGDARVVILSSDGHNWHPKQGIAFDSLKTEQDFGFGGPWRRYAQSKLANILYARELARRYPEITSLSIHPGIVRTGLLNGSSFKETALVYLTMYFSLVEPDEGVHNQLWASTIDKKNLENGHYYVPVGVSPTCNVSKLAKDDTLAAELWDWTEKALTGY